MRALSLPTHRRPGWLRRAIVVLLGTVAVAGSSAYDHRPQQTLSLYDIASNDNVPDARRIADERARLVRLQSGAYGKPEDFSTEARVAFKGDKRRVVADARVLPVAPSTSLPQGWLNRAGLYSWQGGAAATAPAVLPIDVGSAPNAFHPGAFEELWIDYTPSPGIALCKPNIQLVIASHGRKPAAEFLASTVEAELKPIVTVAAAQENWRPKGLRYLVERALGFAPDQNWRYAQDHTNAVMQRRLDVPLNDIEMLDVLVSKGTQIQQINLRISHRKGLTGDGELIEIPKYWDRPIMPDGRDGIRLDLRSLFAQRFPEEWADNARTPRRHHIYLTEVFIFVAGDASQIAPARPIRELSFLGQARKRSAPDDVLLVSQVQQITASSSRMVADLRKLGAGSDAKAKAAMLRLAPPPAVPFCAITIDRVQAVTTYKESAMPLFARRVEDWSRRWGGPFRVLAPRDGQFEDPGIIGYLPFSALTAPQGTKDAGVEIVLKRGPNDQIQLQQSRPTASSIPQYRIAGTDKSPPPGLLSSVGAVLTADGPMPKATLDGEVLVLEGRSKSLELAWPLTAKLDEDALLFFGVDAGSDPIERITVTLDMADRTSIREDVVPNQALRLPTAGREVRSVKVRILPVSSEYRYRLREMALFAPHAVRHAQAFEVALPTPSRLSPIPIVDPDETPTPKLHVEAGHVAGLTSTVDSVPVRFSTVLDPTLEWMRGLHIQYRVPRAAGDADTCPLSLRFNWTNGRTDRRLCLRDPVGTLFIPAAELLNGVANLQSLGKLQSIDWSLQPGTAPDSPYADFFDLRFSVEGIAMLSAADHVRQFHIFDATRMRALVDAQFAAGAEKMWLPLDEELSTSIIKQGNVQPMDHVFFTVDRVVATPKEPMDPERWRALTESVAIQPAPAPWPKLLVLGLVILAGAVVLRMDWLPTARMRSWVVSACGASLRALRWTSGAAFRRLWPLLPPQEAFAGIVALGAIWLAGRQGITFPGLMLLIASALLALAAYARRLPPESQGPHMRHHMSRLRLATLTAAVACFFWSLGQYGLSIQVLWGLLPALAAAYAYLPRLPRWPELLATGLRELLCRYGLALYFAACAGIAAALYGVGSNHRGGGSENYFFTFGAIAAAFAVQAGVRLLEPRLRNRFPSVAHVVDGAAGASYFIGALLSLGLLTAMLVLRRPFAAEQLGVVVYFLLVIGAATQIWALRSGSIAHVGR